MQELPFVVRNGSSFHRHCKLTANKRKPSAGVSQKKMGPLPTDTGIPLLWQKTGVQSCAMAIMTSVFPSDAASPAPHRRRRILVIGLLCTLAVFVVGVIDYFTGIEARVYPLYYLPIAVAALRVSTGLSVTLSFLCSLLWVGVMWVSGASWHPAVFAFNTATQLASFLVIAFLVADIRRRYQHQRDLSRRDPLTDLPNGRAFHEMAGFLIDGVRRTGRPFVLTYIDLDNFKTVNDQHGHLVGDRALRLTADVLRQHLRRSDFCARLGGDEFAVFMPDTDEPAAQAVLNRLLTALVNAMTAQQWPITCSIGAMVFDRTPDSVEEAVHGADALMYLAKQAGKNRVHVLRYRDDNSN